jgi:precorrin-6B methylase 1
VSPAYAQDKGMDLFQKALDNVKEYHMRQTMTNPEDALDQALRDFYNEEKSTEDVGVVLSGD